MTGLALFIDSAPDRELEIRRCYRTAPLFRSVCENLQTAHAAWLRWRDADPSRASDYERLVRDLKAELAALLADGGHTSSAQEPARHKSPNDQG